MFEAVSRTWLGSFGLKPRCCIKLISILAHDHSSHDKLGGATGQPFLIWQERGCYPISLCFHYYDDISFVLNLSTIRLLLQLTLENSVHNLWMKSGCIDLLRKMVGLLQLMTNRYIVYQLLWKFIGWYQDELYYTQAMNFHACLYLDAYLPPRSVPIMITLAQYSKTTGMKLNFALVAISKPSLLIWTSFKVIFLSTLQQSISTGSLGAWDDLVDTITNIHAGGMYFTANFTVNTMSGLIATPQAVNALSFSTAVQALDWTALMANVDEVLLVVNSRGFSCMDRHEDVLNLVQRDMTPALPHLQYSVNVFLHSRLDDYWHIAIDSDIMPPKFSGKRLAIMTLRVPEAVMEVAISSWTQATDKTSSQNATPEHPDS
ncbi:MAG: hypothetical protein NXY57DRAFT_1035762 [Lentinula lateritia]|nr:MAG: hypothetical protein NXY57DRAFT_1035762 [Lentinula lateritia]